MAMSKDQLENEIHTLRDMVNRYAQHLPDCKVMQNTGLCSCGYYDCLQTLRSALRGEKVKLPPQPLPRDAGALS